MVRRILLLNMGARMTATGIIVSLAIAGVLAQGDVQLAGNVRDAAGRPMPAILVEVSSPALEKARSVATDSRGRYRFTDLPQGTYSIAFSLVGSWTERRERIHVPYGSVPFNVRLYGTGESEPQAASSGATSLSGTVFDSQQAIMPGVALLLTGPATRTTTSDAHGQFSFTGLPTGDYALRAALEGFGITVRKMTIAAGTRLTTRVEMSVGGPVIRVIVAAATARRR